jgi:hypothetical protein
MGIGSTQNVAEQFIQAFYSVTMAVESPRLGEIQFHDYTFKIRVMWFSLLCGTKDISIKDLAMPFG